MKKILLLLILTVSIVVASSSNRTNFTQAGLDSNEIKKATPTMVQPNGTATSTPTAKQPDLPETVAPTRTEEPKKNPYEFLIKPGLVADISSGSIKIIFTEGSLKGIEVYTKIVSPIDFGDFSSTSEGFTVGSGYGVIREEKYGNLLLKIHSGYFNGKPLEAEELRKAFEKWGEESQSYVEEKISGSIESGGIIIFNDNEELSLKFKLISSSRLNPEGANNLHEHPTEVLDIVSQETDGLVTKLDEIVKAKKEGHELLVTFCGWDDTKDKPDYYSYVLLIEIEEYGEHSKMSY